MKLFAVIILGQTHLNFKEMVKAFFRNGSLKRAKYAFAIWNYQMR
jgi:hypothetical protein